MEKIEESATINASPDQVYAWMSDLANWPTFVGEYTNVVGDPIQVGGEWDVISRVLGLKLTTHFVRKQQEAAQWVKIQMQGDVSGEMTIRYEAVGEGQTRLSESLECVPRKGLFGGVANAVIGKAVASELSRTVQAVKRGMESGS